MAKALSEMTLEELWELFPITLTGHQDCWARWYGEEAGALRGLLGDGVVVHHVGSTAIEGIWAKPIVDILIEAPDTGAMAAAKDAMEAAGYILMSQSGSRADFNKGYTPGGFAERVFHLHLRLAGDHDELYFRDWLNSHPETAKEYEKLKLGLWKPYEHDRDGYTRGKTDFVARHTATAKEALAGKYERVQEDDNMDMLKLIQNRKSYRGRYGDTPVPREDLRRIMEAGLAAPSGCNKQTVSLIAVDDPGLLSRLRAAIDPPIAKTAPAAILVLTREIYAYRDRLFNVQDYSAAIENMLLAINALGYESCWYEGHITDDDRIDLKLADIMGVPEEYRIVCFLPVGRALQEPRPGPEKKPFGERAWFNGFGKDDTSISKG